MEHLLDIGALKRDEPEAAN